MQAFQFNTCLFPFKKASCVGSHVDAPFLQNTIMCADAVCVVSMVDCGDRLRWETKFVVTISIIKTQPYFTFTSNSFRTIPSGCPQKNSKNLFALMPQNFFDVSRKKNPSILHVFKRKRNINAATKLKETAKPNKYESPDKNRLPQAQCECVLWFCFWLFCGVVPADVG